MQEESIHNVSAFGGALFALLLTVLIVIAACSGNAGDSAVELTVPPGAAVGSDPNGDWLREIADIEPIVGGLPDLISEAPLQRAIQDLEWAGVDMRVVRFDGHVTNIGPGVLDIFGDPNLADPTDPTSHDVWQRTWNGEEWEPLAKPPVRFEAADGHDHFHLMEIARYSMWDIAQTHEVAPGEKIGFCLYDSEPVAEEPGPAEYLVNDGWFCRQGAPLAETVRMGISPGWRDLYDFTLALQWIDVSNAAPGLYWLANEADPFDQILEADEANNARVFGETPFQLPGYIAVPLEIEAGAGKSTFELEYVVIGEPVGPPVFVVDSVPGDNALFDSDGRELEPGDEFTNPTVTWMSNGDLDGPFTFSVVTESSRFPHHPIQAHVVLVDAAAPAPVAIGGFRSVVVPNSRLNLVNGGSEAATWQIISDETGAASIEGATLTTGSVEGSITVQGTLGDRTGTVVVSVEEVRNRPPFVQDPIRYVEPDPAEVNAAAEQTDARHLIVGAPVVLLLPVLDADGDRVEVTVSDLPAGLAFDSGAGVIRGTPTELGLSTVIIAANDGTEEIVQRFNTEVIATE